MLHTHGLGGACNRNICAVVFESMLSPHKHVLTLGLPAFCQCRTYLASRETAVFLVMRGACMSAVVGQVHMSARLLFRYVCCDMLQQDSGRCDLPAPKHASLRIHAISCLIVTFCTKVTGSCVSLDSTFLGGPLVIFAAALG
jgi:hypothetical protein